MTLEQLITESADYVKADLTETDDDTTATKSRLTSALNEAKTLTAKKLNIKTSEDIALDEDSCFEITDLTKTFWKLVTVTYSDCDVQTQIGTEVWCDAPALGTVTVEYAYIPADMTLVTDTLDLPESVSWRLLCYYAAAQYYRIRGTAASLAKANVWMSQWEDGLRNLGGKNLRRKSKPDIQLKL